MYDTFIRASRPWSYRYPLELIQGNNGNQSSPDTHAAARYVEMKASEISDVMFAGLKKNAIGEQWYNNYDDTELIPSVFPSIGFWNIVNGCSGIAVAMATSVPQFNLREVNNALIKIIQNPNVSFDEIYCVPDFATGGTIINANAVKESIRNGNGESIRMRAKLDYVPDQNMIRATELPYGVFTDTIIEQLAEVTTADENYGIERVVDHTEKIADIYIYLTKGANPKKMITKLYKDTALENWYSVNMILLDNGRFPKLFGWRAACDAYISHIRECERNIVKFDLDKALARLNIVDGLLLAVANIDEVVAIIRSSNSPSEASQKLIARFGFNEEQTKAILAMKLSSLTKIDAIKLNDEREELTQKIEEYRHLLNDNTALDEKLISILQDISTKYGDERRTQALNVANVDESENEQIKETDISIMLFDNNTIRINERYNLQGGKKGKKGVNIKAPKGANLINTLYSTNLGMLAAFTSAGKMYTFTLSDLDYDKDYSVYEVMPIGADEKVKLIIDMTTFNAYNDLITISKKGFVKKSNVSEYSSRARKGVAAVKLDTDDTLINVFLTKSDKDKIMIGTASGYYNCYEVSEIGETGRATKGVKGIKLGENDFISSATIIRDGTEYKGILTIASTGKGKISPMEEYGTTGRAARGNKAMALKDDETLSVIFAIPQDKETLYLVSNNKAVSVDIASIAIQNRATMGALIIDARNSNSTIEVM